MKNLRIGAIGAVLLMVAAACGGSTTSSADTIAFAAKAYPAEGPADCSAEGYYGFKRITSTDASTVVFELCAPDVAFIQKLALTNFVINDSGYLQRRLPTAASLRSQTARAHTSSRRGRRAPRSSSSAMLTIGDSSPFRALQSSSGSQKAQHVCSPFRLAQLTALIT